MDVETLRASWEKSVSKNKRCRSMPSLAPRHTVHPEQRRSMPSLAQRHTVHPEHKPNNQKKRSGRPPWVIAKEQHERIAKMDDADRAKQIEMRNERVALKIAQYHPEPPQKILNTEVICIDCDEPLATTRLTAKPNAARCIECQCIHEKKERQRG